MKRSVVRAAVIAAVSIVVLTACEDDPTSPQEAHFEAEGLELVDSGVRVFRYFQGEVDESVADAIEIDMGLSPLLSVRFLGSDGTSIGTPESEEHYLGWVVGDTNVVVVEQHEGELWEFHLIGREPGETTIEFRIYHGDHYDFHTIDLPLHVDAPAMPERIALLEESTGTELATTVHEGEGTATGVLTVGVGVTSGHIEVEFFAESGASMTPPEGLLYGIEVASTNMSVFTVAEPTEDEPHALSIAGVGAGSAELEIAVIAVVEGEDHDHSHDRIAHTSDDDHSHGGAEVHFTSVPVVVQ